MRRVVITGIDLVTALGTGRVSTWKRLLGGETGIRRIQSYDPGSLRTQLGAEIDDLEPELCASRRQLRLTTRGDQLAIVGAVQAYRDAGIGGTDYEPDRIGVFVGGGKEISRPEHLLEGTLAARGPDGRACLGLLGERASSAFYPLYYVEGLQSAALFHLSQILGLTGANAYFHGTAEAGANAVGRAFRSIRRGESDAAVAGGFDDATCWWTMSKLDGLGLLTDRDELGPAAYRPYQADRAGAVLGEGAAFMVLEEYESAKRRGAHVYAEITGAGSTFDGVRMPGAEPSGAALAAAAGAALDESELDGSDVDYVAADGAATTAGDVSEAAGLRAALRVNQRASSVKPAIGHLLAAAGAVNVAVCALAIDEGVVPPTLNLDEPDADCSLDWIRGQAREQRVRTGLAIARGMEGQQVVLALAAAGAKGATR